MVLPEGEGLEFLEILYAGEFVDAVAVEGERFQFEHVGNILNFLIGAGGTSILLSARLSTSRFLLASRAPMRVRQLF